MRVAPRERWWLGRRHRRAVSTAQRREGPTGTVEEQSQSSVRAALARGSWPRAPDPCSGFGQPGGRASDGTVGSVLPGARKAMEAPRAWAVAAHAAPAPPSLSELCLFFKGRNFLAGQLGARQVVFLPGLRYSESSGERRFPREVFTAGKARGEVSVWGRLSGDATLGLGVGSILSRGWDTLRGPVTRTWCLGLGLPARPGPPARLTGELRLRADSSVPGCFLISRWGLRVTVPQVISWPSLCWGHSLSVPRKSGRCALGSPPKLCPARPWLAPREQAPPWASGGVDCPVLGRRQVCPTWSLSCFTVSEL